MWVYHGTIHYANLSAEQFFGVGRARLVGHPLSEFVPVRQPQVQVAMPSPFPQARFFRLAWTWKTMLQRLSAHY